MRVNFQALVVPFNDSTSILPSEKQWDLCASYYGICVNFLDPTDIRDFQTCGNVSTAYPYGQIQHYNGSCTCGTMDILDDRNFEIVVDGLLFETINTEYLYIAPPTASYSLMAGHNPYKQLLYQASINSERITPQQ